MTRGDILSAAERIEERFGGTFRRLTKDVLQPMPAVSTGSLLLNEALNESRGYPEGCIVEVFGPQHSGKTLMGYLAIAECQKKFPDRPCLLIDAEHQFMYQAKWAQTLGVDVEKLMYTTVTSAEEAFEKMEFCIYGDVEMDKEGQVKRIVRPGNFGIIMIDSVSQLVPLEEIHKAMDRSTRMAALASVMSRGLRKVVSAQSLANSKTILYFINQIRANPNVMFGNPETRSGGKALAFYDTIAFRVSKVHKSDERDEKNKIISHRVKIKFEKNKTGQMPADAIEFKICHNGMGVDNNDELFTVGEMNNLIVKFKRRYNFVKAGTEEILDPTIEDFCREDFAEIIKTHPKMKDMIMNFIKNGSFYVKDENVKEDTSSLIMDEEDIDEMKKSSKAASRESLQNSAEPAIETNVEPITTASEASVDQPDEAGATSETPADGLIHRRGRRRKEETNPFQETPVEVPPQ